MDDGTVNDFGRGYQSPQQHITIGGGIWIGSAALVLAVIALTLVLSQMHDTPQIIEARSKEAAAVAVVRSGDALQKAQLNEYKSQTIITELKKHGIDVPSN